MKFSLVFSKEGKGKIQSEIPSKVVQSHNASAETVFIAQQLQDDNGNRLSVLIDW